MLKKIIIIVFVLFALVIAGVVGIYKWRNHIIAQQDERALQAANNALKTADARTTLAIVNTRQSAVSTSETDWLSLEIDAAARLGLLPRLQNLHNEHPEVFLQNETACQLLTRALVHSGDPIKAGKLMQHWRDRGTNSHIWFGIEIDTMLLAGERDGALQKLQSTEFEGAADAGRLSRLALLSRDDMPAAWEYLGEAYDKAPRNTDVRLFRGQILETMGSNHMARVEYVAAHVANPDNVLNRDHLAEFYRRRGNHLNALTTWIPSLTNSAPNYIWLKSLFWSRVARGMELPSYDRELVEDSLHGLVKFIDALDPDEFWNEDRFSVDSTIQGLADTRAEICWLRALENLRLGDEAKALELLRSNVLKRRSFDGVLETTLTRVLNYRLNGSLNPVGVAPPSSAALTNRHSLFLNLATQSRLEEFTDAKIPTDLEALLRHRNGPALILMAAGWLEAGAQLFDGKPWPETVPDGVVYTTVQALRMARDSSAALAHLAQYGAKPPALATLYAELLFATGDTVAGVKQLGAVSRSDTPAGYRAAWLLSTHSLSQSNYAVATQTVRQQPRLAKSTAGNELLARIALATGATNDALNIYRNIRTNSIEARAFLARDAYRRKDWALAEELTDELMLLLPDQLQLRANLQAIPGTNSDARTDQ
jgi:hypothetical protein